MAKRLQEECLNNESFAFSEMKADGSSVTLDSEQFTVVRQLGVGGLNGCPILLKRRRNGGGSSLPKDGGKESEEEEEEKLFVLKGIKKLHEAHTEFFALSNLSHVEGIARLAKRQLFKLHADHTMRGSDCQYFILLEYYCKGDLCEHVWRNGELNFKTVDALRVFYKTLKAVDGMHRTGVYNADIKPENILLCDSSSSSSSGRGSDSDDTTDNDDSCSDDDTSSSFSSPSPSPSSLHRILSAGPDIAIADFGHFARRDFEFGTNATLAPEQVANNNVCGAALSADVDRTKAEMWQLGVTLFYCLYRFMPFGTNGELAVYQDYDGYKFQRNGLYECIYNYKTKVAEKGLDSFRDSLKRAFAHAHPTMSRNLRRMMEMEGQQSDKIWYLLSRMWHPEPQMRGSVTELLGLTEELLIEMSSPCP